MEPVFYMQRCLDLARLGAGYTAPNPMVGAVLVYNNRIIGEGYHQTYGKAHAEVNALNSVKETDRALIPHATLYVSLEPCSHYGKTPPCADLIIQRQIKQVVIACSDPFEQVAGRGIQKLQNAGINVQLGVLEKEAQWLNRRFIHAATQHLPWVVLKWAQTADVFFAPPNHSRRWITNAPAKILAHQWRTQEQAIMVGTQTALADNPMLNVRNWFGKPPLRIVLDKNLSLPAHLHLFTQPQPTLVVTQQPAPLNAPAHITYFSVPFDHNLLPALLQHLYQLNIHSLLVEGGQQLLQSFIDQNLWNEARVITAQTTRWGEGIKAPILPPAAQVLTTDYLFDNRIQILTPMAHRANN